MILCIIEIICIIITIGINTGLYIETPYDCLYNGGAVYNRCNKSMPGLLCNKGTCYKTMYNVLDKCPDVMISKEDPWNVPDTQNSYILSISQFILLFALLVINIWKFFIKLRSQKISGDNIPR